MEWKLEVIVVPVDVDHRVGEDFRVVQLTPNGSGCSVKLMRGTRTEPGSLKGLQLVVVDIDAARAELTGRGVQVSEVFHFEDGRSVPGPSPRRADYESFISFSDPDGNVWLVQEVPSRAPATA